MAIEKLPMILGDVFYKHLKNVKDDDDYTKLIDKLEDRIRQENPLLKDYIDKKVEESNDAKNVRMAARFTYIALSDQFRDNAPYISRDSIESLAINPPDIDDIESRTEGLPILKVFINNTLEKAKEPQDVRKLAYEVIYLIAIENSANSFDAMYSKYGLPF